MWVPVCVCVCGGGGGRGVPEVPYSGHTIFPAGIHEVTVVIETETGDIFSHALKHVHWRRLRGVNIIHPYLLVRCTGEGGQ